MVDPDRWTPEDAGTSNGWIREQNCHCHRGGAAMPCYIANHRKKRRILARRETDLIRALQRGESEEKVKLAAEEVKAARLRVLNVERSRVPPSGLNAARFEMIDAEIRECLSVPVDAIVQEFRRRLRVRAGPRDGSDQV